MKTNKLKLDNVVEVTYIPQEDNNNALKTWLTAMVAVTEASLPPMSEDDKKYSGRLLQVYFDKAAEILQNEIGPVTIYPSHGFRFMGDMIDACPTVYAVPIEALEQLRDKLYEQNLITMEGLKQLNMLIGEYTID